MNEQELEQAKETAKAIFISTMRQGRVVESLFQKFDEETLKFILKAIIGAFDTGFQCCIHYVLNEQDD